MREVTRGFAWLRNRVFNLHTMPQLANVNTTDIPAAIRLGCRTMSRVFDADDDERPFFESSLLPEPLLRWNASHSESHVPGRHLNALLNAEAVLGDVIDPAAVDKHRRAAFYSYGGGIPWPLNRESKDGRPVRAIPHNIREGFHALAALARYRDDAAARAIAESSIDWILRRWSPARVHDAHCGWDEAAIRAAGARLVHSPNESFVLGLGRAIGPLVKYYRATGHAPALELAVVLADTATTHYYLPEGDFDPAKFSTHTHSTTCVMSGLAQLAALRNDMPLLLRVKAFYDNGLWRIRDALGWVIESTWRRGLDADIGEVNNTGDIVETALILGAAGFAEYFADAERIVRCHLLPSQVRDVSFIHDVPDPPNDGYRDVADRHLGAYGFPTPYGHMPPGATWLSFNMDIVGGAVGSLCEALRSAVFRTADGVRVNLLFDHDGPDVTVRSPYSAPYLAVTPKSAAPLWVRLPRWALVEATTLPGARREGDWLFFPAPEPGIPIEIRFALAESELVLKHDAHDIRVRLRGDSVASMDNFGAPLTFFEAY
jgi:hypothetical protein